MVYTVLTRLAAEICIDAHQGQKDKAGFPYCLHPIHLAERMDDEESCCVALLHDVVEDCPRYSFAILEEKGFGKAILDALKLLTHPKGVPYMDYIRALGENPIARKVKIADLKHNLDTSRGAGVPPKFEIYQQALAYLEGKES